MLQTLNVNNNKKSENEEKQSLVGLSPELFHCS